MMGGSNKAFNFQAAVIGNTIKMLISMNECGLGVNGAGGDENVGIGNRDAFPAQMKCKLTGVLPESIVGGDAVQSIKSAF